MAPLAAIDTTALIFALAVPGSLFLLLGVATLFEQIGKGGLWLDRDGPPAAPPDSPAGRHEREQEIRQLLEAKSARRERRGQDPLDVEAELRRLTAQPAPVEQADEALRAEVRQLVIARNARRADRGQAPLDVEAEVERQLRDLGA